MTCEECRGQMPELWEGLLGDEPRAALEMHLASCVACRTEADRFGKLWQRLEHIPPEDPPPGLRARFYERLDAYQHAYQDARNEPWWKPAWTPRLAFGIGLGFSFATLIIGFLTGFLINERRDNSQITQLHTEVTNMRQMIALSLLQQQNASDRLKGVNWAYRVEQPDTEVLAALLYTVNHDPNINVRLAAVDALRTFADSPIARRGLVQAIAKQDSPMVQIALIDQLTEVHDRAALPALEALAANASANGEVRQRAQWALRRLQ